MYKNKGGKESHVYCTRHQIRNSAVLTILEASLQTAQSWGGYEARDRLVKSWQRKLMRAHVHGI